MEFFKTIQPLATVVIAILGILSFLLIGVNSLLNAKIDPLKSDIELLRSDLNQLRTNFNQRFDKLYELQLQNKRASALKN